MESTDVHQMTRSLPPSIGTWAPVVLAKAGPQRATHSRATSALSTSVWSTLLALYSSIESPYWAARAASTSSDHTPVSKTALGWITFTRIPSPPHSRAATRASCVSAALDAEYAAAPGP